MTRRPFLPLGMLALTGTTYAIAQSIDGLDLQAVMGRKSESAAEATALASEVARRGDALREDALEAARGGEANLNHAARTLRVGSDGQIDFDEILSAAGGSQGEGGKAPQLMVFASLSMPPESLKPLIRDTAKAGGVVVFNGFPGNSMKAFQEGIVRVVDNQASYNHIGIDPRLFRAFHVTSVPVFVVATSDFDPCDGFDCVTTVPPHDRLSGNVTLRHALDTFADGNGPGATIAEGALRRLHGSAR